MKRLAIILGISLMSVSVSALEIVRSAGGGMGETISIRQSAPTDLLSIPTGSLEHLDWQLETGYNRQFELSDFDQFFIAGSGRYGRFTLALGLQQFGSADFYREQTIKSSLGFTYDSLTVGLMLGGMQVNFGDDRDFYLRAVSLGAGASYQFRTIAGGVAIDNINSPELYDGSVAFEPVWSVYTEFTGHRSFSVLGRLTMENYQKPQLAIGQRIALAEQSSFTWGLSTEPFVFGGGIQLYVSRAAISYAANYHPVLGLSHTVTIATGKLFKRQRDKSEFD